MPRTSERAHALEVIDAAIESAACAYLLASDEEQEEDEEDHIRDLVAIQPSMQPNAQSLPLPNVDCCVE